MHLRTSVRQAAYSPDAHDTVFASGWYGHATGEIWE